MVETLTEMPGGTARQLLADIVRSGQRLAEEAGDADQPALGQVLIGASRAARRVEGLEETLVHLDRRSESVGGDQFLAAEDSLARARDRLVQELLDVLTALGRAQGRVALAGATEDGGLAALAAELEASLAANADAHREVEEYLASPAEAGEVSTIQ